MKVLCQISPDTLAPLSTQSTQCKNNWLQVVKKCTVLGYYSTKITSYSHFDSTWCGFSVMFQHQDKWSVGNRVQIAHIKLLVKAIWSLFRQAALECLTISLVWRLLSVSKNHSLHSINKMARGIQWSCLLVMLNSGNFKEVLFAKRPSPVYSYHICVHKCTVKMNFKQDVQSCISFSWCV